MTYDRSVSGDGAQTIVRRLWQFCGVLRDDGLSYPDYVEQLTYLLFLKLSQEREDGSIPNAISWNVLMALDAETLHERYSEALLELSRNDGMLGLIFGGARNKLRDPAKLSLLFRLMNETEWSGLSNDLKGDAYEGLLEKTAQDRKTGAGQYFTPRALIDAITQCIKPRFGEVVCDPACGTGGFLLSAYRTMMEAAPDLSPQDRGIAASASLRGTEIVEEVARLAAMNLFLQGIGASPSGELPIQRGDSLASKPETLADVVLTNPPFGIRGSVTYSRQSRADGETIIVPRPDFWVETANKQLNFLQHIVSMLAEGGRAAVVVPDNVLFEGGSAASVRRHLLTNCNFHTMLRLPSGLFYAAGVASNVLFFRKRLNDEQPTDDEQVFVYDLRSRGRYTMRSNPLHADDLAEFTRLYHESDRTEGTHYRSVIRADVLADPECRLDFDVHKPASQEGMTGLARVDELSALVRADLEEALRLMSGSHASID